jgi:hypothetical protein
MTRRRPAAGDLLSECFNLKISIGNVKRFLRGNCRFPGTHRKRLFFDLLPALMYAVAYILMLPRGRIALLQNCLSYDLLWDRFAD